MRSNLIYNEQIAKKFARLTYQVLKADNMDFIREYELEPFTMTLQSIERTFIDKVFALCDYYINLFETA